MIKLFQHLVPRALAWRTTVDTTLRRYLEGLAGMPADVREFVDLVYQDLFPSTTRELPTWEPQFALLATGSEDDRRNRLAAAWRATGGQSPDYIQQRLHDAGFTTVFVYEWWETGPPYVARDPRLYTTPPLVGTYQCEGSTPWECFDTGPGDPLAPHCDAFLANEPGYLVNLDLTRRAPPPVPDDPTRWPYFLYFAGEVFPELAPIPAERFDELKELLLRICPAQQWLVLMVDPLSELEIDGFGFGSGPFGTVPLGV